jgi:hypothetical protein
MVAASEIFRQEIAGTKLGERREFVIFIPSLFFSSYNIKKVV